MQTSLHVLGVYFASLLATLNFSSISPQGDSLPGDHMPGVPPVPISNTAVKPRAANGSWTIGPARVGRCQVYSPVPRKGNRASSSFLPGARQAGRYSQYSAQLVPVSLTRTRSSRTSPETGNSASVAAAISWARTSKKISRASTSVVGSVFTNASKCSP